MSRWPHGSQASGEGAQTARAGSGREILSCDIQGKKEEKKGDESSHLPGLQFPWRKNFPVGATPKSTTLVTKSSN